MLFLSRAGQALLGSASPGVSQNKHLGTGHGRSCLESCRIFLPWLCTGTNLCSVGFPCGVGAGKELSDPSRVFLLVSVCLSASCTLWGSLTQCHGSCSLGLGFFLPGQTSSYRKPGSCYVFGLGLLLVVRLGTSEGFGAVLSH